jgi:cysteine desulfurase/selenocysteine lyase
MKKLNSPNSLYIVRQDFPILQTTVNNHPLVYLDNAATSQKPNLVIDTISDFYQNYNANINRGQHYLGETATIKFEAARDKVRQFINAKFSAECIFTKGTTESINLVATSFGSNFQSGDEVIISELEHHANIVPWYILKQQKNIEIKIIPLLENGELDLTNFAQLLTAKTKLVSLSHVSNTLGTINPIKKIIDLSHSKHIPVLIDGAQAINHFPIDVQDLDCDFYAFSGHKMFGPTGIGVLYGKKQYLENMPPYQGGGQMILEVDFDNIVYNELPFKFEAGTTPIAQAVGLGAAIDYLQQLDQKIGLDAIRQHEHELLHYATDKLQQIPGLKIFGQAPDKVSIISFTLDNIHPHDIGTMLNESGIAIRTGHLCTMPIMKFYNVPAFNRASFSIYNTMTEIDKLYGALLGVKKFFNK